MKAIKLTKGYVALVDDEDYNKVAAFPWSATVCRDSTGAIKSVYAKRTEHGTSVMMHRFILGLQGRHIFVDHENRCGLDNRRRNMRVCTNKLNQGNVVKKAGKSSVYKGVCWVKRHSNWQASIRHNGRLVHLGKFDTEKEASEAYNNAATSAFGEFAVLNREAKTHDHTI